MTEPLIDRDSIKNILAVDVLPMTLRGCTDKVMAYLREVLTPETLAGRPYDDRDAWYPVDCFDLHHRIFGEDQ